MKSLYIIDGKKLKKKKKTYFTQNKNECSTKKHIFMSKKT